MRKLLSIILILLLILPASADTALSGKFNNATKYHISDDDSTDSLKPEDTDTTDEGLGEGEGYTIENTIQTQTKNSLYKDNKYNFNYNNSLTITKHGESDEVSEEVSEAETAIQETQKINIREEHMENLANTSAKQKFYVLSTNADALAEVAAIEGIVKYTAIDGGAVIIIPVSQIETLEAIENIVIYDNVNYQMYMHNQSIVVNNEYKIRNMERKQLEVTYTEIESAKDKGASELEKLGIESDNPFEYYFLYTEQAPYVTSVAQAYDEATSIIYMTDDALWGTPEKWITPNDVYGVTPDVATNPTSSPVSDCEEHAISFVAMCREAGLSSEEVRVATGYVEINGQRYGHAWAQLLQDDGTWLNVETTCGSYIENGELHIVEPIDREYYTTHIYPVVEIWSYFNDEYYITEKESNAPTSWSIETSTYYTGSYTNDDLETYLNMVLDYIETELYKLN